MLVGNDNHLLMYYVGFERLAKIPYRMMIGSAISLDAGVTFQKTTEAPVLDRVLDELFFRAGPLVFRDGQEFVMLYAGGSHWKSVGGHLRPVYDLRVTHSSDGYQWESPGQVILPVDDRNFGFGRPWLGPPTDSPSVQVLLSVRDADTSRYRMGIASFGRDWDLVSLQYGIGLEPNLEAPEAENTVFAATVSVGSKLWCFYNGDDFGRDGVLLAELLEP